MDLTSAESKATCKEIEKWVQEKYGFHVTNLNIAQIKQKHEIIERENYNKPKSENGRQPECPEEKVKAIELIKNGILHGFVACYDNEIIGFCNADLKDNY